jgi:hypothetical protein
MSGRLMPSDPGYWDQVHAWADAVGNWHVRVTQRGVGNRRRATRLARARMIEELTARVSINATRLRVQLVSQVSRDGVLYLEYVETWKGERS